MRRKRPRGSIALLALSLVTGAGTAVALHAHLRTLEARAGTPVPTVSVVAAAGDLTRGTALSPDDVQTLDVPGDAVPPGALRDPAAAVGHTLTTTVAAGEVLTDLRLVRAGPVAALVPDGLRAVPLTVRAPADLVVPGDRVDVLAAAPGEPFARTVASEVEILSARPAAAAEGMGEATTYVLLVGPETSEALAAARMTADLSVAVVPPPGGAPE